MKKDAITYLNWANPKLIANSYEQVFYDENASEFNIETSKFNENRSIFDMIKSVAVLRGLLNRHLINDEIEMFPLSALQNPVVENAILLQMPSFEFEGHTILIPTYSVEINDLYYQNQSVLKVEKSEYVTNPNYDVIDPFKTYGFSLLSSPFTRLIPLDINTFDTKVFYHHDFETMFFVRKDCTLEAELPLFDEKVKNRNRIDLFKSLNRVAKAYFDNDIVALFTLMKDLNLISTNCYEECIQHHHKYLKRMNKNDL